jgi:hypothetical protein
MLHRRATALLLAALGVAALALQLHGVAAAARAADNILLSRIIWGMPSERVAQALKLDRSQYTILHDPVNLSVTIYQLEGKLLNFPEFRVVYLNFSPEGGLFKVNGFYNGAIGDAVAALKQRYGDPDLVKRTALNQHYRWEFEETALSITDTQFEIALK